MPIARPTGANCSSPALKPPTDWPASASTLPRWAISNHIVRELSGTAVRVRRFDVGLHRGYALCSGAIDLADCRSACVKRASVLPARTVWTALRIEAGLPRLRRRHQRRQPRAGSRTHENGHFVHQGLLSRPGTDRPDRRDGACESGAAQPAARPAKRFRRPAPAFSRTRKPPPLSARSLRPPSPLRATHPWRWLCCALMPVPAEARSSSRAATGRSLRQSFGTQRFDEDTVLCGT